MSAIRQVYLICDGDGCDQATGEYDADTVAEARRLAKGLEWVRTKDGQDLCGSCAYKETERDKK